MEKNPSYLKTSLEKTLNLQSCIITRTDRRLKRLFLLENVITITFFVLGAIFVFIDIPHSRDVLLLLETVLVGLLIFDLDLARGIAGTEGIIELRIFLSFFGATVSLLVWHEAIIGILIVVPIVIGSLLILSLVFWSRIDWEKNGRLQHTYRHLMRTETKKGSDLKNSRIRLLRKTTMPKIDFLKILSFMVHLLELEIIALLLSALVSIIGFNYFAELALLVLFFLWTAASFWNLFLKHKFRSLWLKQDKLEETTWMLLAKQFLNTRGILYVCLFIPSILVSMVSIIVSFGLLFSLFVNTFRISLSIVILVFAYLAIIAIAFNLLINSIYISYIMVRLFSANANRKKRGGYRREIRLLPSPRLCLIASLSFFLLLNLPIDILDIPFSDSISLFMVLIILVFSFSTIVWARCIILHIKKIRATMTTNMENHLALGVAVSVLPFYRFMGISAIIALGLFFALLLIVSEMLSIVKEPRLTKKPRAIVEATVVFSLISLYLYFLEPTLRWAIPLCILAILLVLILALPDRFGEIFFKHILLIEEIDTSGGSASN